MAIPRATLSFREGQLQIPPEQSDNTIAILGYCTAGTTGQIYPFDGATPNDAVTTLGYGKGVQLLADLLTVPNHGKFYFVPLASTAGVLSAVVAAGTTPPTVTLTGNSRDDIVGRVEILTAGARGTATFRYCLDYDSTTGTGTWSNPIVTAATYLMDNSGVTLNFASGTYATDNVYTFTGAAPTHSNVQITDGLDALYAAGVDVGGIFIVTDHAGALDSDRATAAAATFAAITPKIDTFESAGYKYRWCMLPAPSPVATTSSGLATWRAALTSATMQALVHNRMVLAAGYGKQASTIDSRIYRRSIGWRALERLSTADISEALGRVATGPIRTMTSIEHDEGTTGGLSDGTIGQRYLTLRTFASYSGYYVADEPTFAQVGSDYAKLYRLRVINRAAKVGRAVLVGKLMDTAICDATTGQILESEAAQIDSELTYALDAALIQSPSKSGKGHASSVAGRVSRTDNLVTTETLTGQFSVQPLGYFRTISFTIGFTKSNVSAAA